MPELAILADMYVPGVGWDAFAAYRERTVKALEGIAGFNSMTFWREENDPDRYLVVTSYGSIEAAAIAFGIQSEAGFLIEQVESISVPANVHRMNTQYSVGKTFHMVDVGQFLSATFRRSEPGYEAELQEELQYIFAELEMIPGFLGGKIGPNDTIPGEVPAIAFWNSREAYSRSVPNHAHDVILFERVL